MPYEPPKTIWEVHENLNHYEPLEHDHPLRVPTEKGRGDFNHAHLLRDIGIEEDEPSLQGEPRRLRMVFAGHSGCGKSTELLNIAHVVNTPERFFVVFADAEKELDRNNIDYSEVLMAMAKRLVDRLLEVNIRIPAVFLTNLQNWFAEKVEQHESTKEFAMDLKAGIKLESGLPLLAKLFAGLTNTFKIGSTYKNSLRQIIKNTFSQFTVAFNELIAAAEEEIRAADKGRRILFIIDGIDKIRFDHLRRFWIEDVHQLLQVQSNFIYCAPVSLMYEGNDIAMLFPKHHVFPMIKLTKSKSDPGFNQPAYDVMRNMVYRRAPKEFFDSEETVDLLIKYSGGNPRELIRLLLYAFRFADDDLFTREAAERAVKELATDYRRFLSKDDYQLLCAIDRNEGDEASNEAKKLLLNLALLEYNRYWWSTHPVIQTLPAYQKCAEQADAAQ